MPVRKKKLDICSKCERSPRPAITAAKSGHVNCLSTAYKDIGVLNERDDYGATPMHYAARFGKLNCLEWLVNCSGVSPNAASSSGSTAAHEAASKGHLDCLRYLILNTSCSAQDRTYEGATVFHMACRFGRSNCVKFLLEQAECSPCDKGTSNVTPVHICAAHDHLSCLKQLTQRTDYVPNQVTVHGATPTYFAAQEGSLDCLMWLVNKGDGDLYMEATDGMRPIHASAQGGKLECIKWMVSEAKLPADLKAADGATPAHFSAASGQLECLEWLLDNGGSVTDRDDLGGTPAHDAAEQGQIAALELLVNKGADVSIIDNEGLTPMDVAKDNQQDDCVEMLFKITQPVFTSPKDLEKQKMFEESMMSGMDEDQREIIWTKAKFDPGVKLSPGLKLLLAGEAEPESNFSIDIPTGSLRHSRHSSICSRLSTKKDNARSPLTDDVFKEPPKEIKGNEDTATFSTFKSDAKKESTIEPPESRVVENAPATKGSMKRKESFLKRLFSRKRSSTSVSQHPPSKKKHHTKASKDSKTVLKENASLQEKIEFHQTPLSVEVFDGDGTTLPAIGEETQQVNAAAVNSSLHTTTVEINSTANDDDNQTAVKTVAESVAANAVNQALLAVENDISKSVEAEVNKSPPQSKTSTKALKAKKKKKKESKNTDTPAEKAVVTRNRASTSYSAPFVETVRVEFKKLDEDKNVAIKTSDSDYDTSSESNESNTSDVNLGIQPMEIGEFENFGEEVHKQQSTDANVSDALLTTPTNPPIDGLPFNQPANGIPSVVVRAIHKDLQVLSESIDKDLDKLINENQDQEDHMQKMDEDISSSISNIAMEKLEEAQLIPHMPLLESTPVVAATPTIMISTPVSTDSTSLVKQLSNTFNEENHTHATTTTTTTTASRQSGNIVKRLSGNFNNTVISDKMVAKSPSFEGRILMKKSNSIQERLKLFGEQIPENTIPNGSLQSSGVDGKQPELGKVEESDVVMPLKSISNASLRRSSLTNVDKLKLDGLKGEAQESLSLEAKKQKWHRSPLELSNKPGSPVAVRRRIDSGSQMSSHRLSLKKHDPESLELFMNSANLDWLTKLHEKTLEDAKALAVKRAEALLEEPTLNEQTTPDVFRKILSQENNMFIWCVKDTWYSWLEEIDELPWELESEDCYILLHVQDLGPLKYHIFLWMGDKAKESNIKSTCSWCSKLLQSLPGRPVVYKETEGHESSLFQSTFQDVLVFNSSSVMYYNDTLEKPTLYKYKGADLTEVETCVQHLEEDIGDIMLLATSTNIFIWCPPQLWRSDPSAIWEAANVYLAKNAQPSWAPLTVLTQHGETKDFFAHLCGWQHTDLHLAAKFDQLTLPKRKRQTIRYPAIGKLKIWMLKGSIQTLLPLDKLGQFSSTNAYLVEFKFQRWQTVFLWVGSQLSCDQNDDSILMTTDDSILRTATDLCKKMTTKPELILIPQGLETKEFLNLFKGKCLIQDPKLGSDVHLYEVTGTDVLRIKTIEVKPVAASLNSSHSFILCNKQNLFAWSGQFSNQAERRGALILCNIVGPSDSLPVLLAEGMETPEFWSLLGGKADYPHHSITNEIPDYYANSVYLYSNNRFIMKHRLSKSELKSTDILLVWTSNEIYIWSGSETNMDDTASISTVKDYIKQYHSRKFNEFVVHLLHEGSEPQHFWDLLTFSAALQSPSSVDVMKTARNDKLEDEHDEIDSLISDINSMVVNLSTSSVPNINELAMESGKGLSMHRDRFRSLKDSPLSQSCQADLQFAGADDKKAKKGDNAKTEVKETQPKRQRWSFKVDPTTYQWLTIPAVHHAEMAQKKNKKNAKGYMMNVTVEDQSGASTDLVVDSSVSAIALAFLAGSELHLVLNRDLTLVEVINDIGVERIIEDHEVVKDVVSLWPKKSSARLVVKEKKDKHQLWTSAMMEEEIRGFIENDTVTRETFTFNTLQKKNKWHKQLYCFRHDGIYSMPEGGDTMPVQKQLLVAKFSTHNVYVASKLTKKHPPLGPTSFGIVLKPSDSFKEKDCIIMCAQDPGSWIKWMQLFRLLKFGVQLKGNYLAVEERLKARQSKINLNV